MTENKKMYRQYISVKNWIFVISIVRSSHAVVYTISDVMVLGIVEDKASGRNNITADAENRGVFAA